MDQLQAVEQIEQNQTQHEANAERRLPMTYAEFLDTFVDSIHAEWANGEAIIFMPPSIRHQDLVLFLSALIAGFVKIFDLGKALNAPCEMRLEVTGTSREPDVMYLAKANYGRQSENRINGPADLVIEVISNESASRDRTDKFYEYQANGVREYWVIDPRPRLARADFWVLGEDGRYQPVPIEPKGIYHSTVLPNFKLDVNNLLTDDSLDHIQALIDMVGLDTLARARSKKQ
jgi:Uma2 family endonuclease